MSIRRALSVSALAAAALTLFVTPAANADGCGYGGSYVVYYDHYTPRYVHRHRHHHYRHRSHHYGPRFDHRRRRAVRRNCRWY